MKGHAVVHAAAPGAWAHAPAVLPAPVLAGAGLAAAATVAGAWLARRPGHREIRFAAAAGALLIIAGLHLLPGAWAEAGGTRIWPGLVPMAAIAGFAAAGLATRAGCACQEGKAGPHAVLSQRPGSADGVALSDGGRSEERARSRRYGARLGGSVLPSMPHRTG